MSATRFLRVALTYGCHVAREIPLRDDGGPYVLLGPNGAGKSTLLEGVVRTLFGFNRRVQDDRDRLEARAPWSGEGCRGTVVLEVEGEGVWEVSRDFASHEVVLTPRHGDGEPWRGDGNPGSANREAKEYRAHLRRLLGFGEREAYEATGWVRQGELTHTRLDAELLQLAAGGHGNVDQALEALREAHREITVEPIEPDGRAALRPRPLEEASAERERLEAELEEADRASRRRAPIRRRIDEAEARLRTLRAEISLLEDAQGPMAERRALRAERQEHVTRLRALGGVRRKVQEARRRIEDAAADLAPSGEVFPEDFPQRLSTLEGLWYRRRELEARLARARAEADEAEGGGGALPVVAAAAVAAVGAVAVVLGRGAVGWPVLLAGLVGAALAGVRWSRRREARERHRTQAEESAASLERVEGEIRRALEGVPGGESLRPSNAAERRERWERQRRQLERHAEAERRLRQALDEAQEALGRAEAAAREDEPPAEAAERAVERLEEASEELRTGIARRDLALEQSEAGSLPLPEGVEPEPAAVKRALERRRTEEEEARSARRQAERELLELGAPSRSPVALRERLGDVEARVRELERRARAHRRAHALVRDAYEAFRERDEARLLARVSERMSALSGGALGPVEPRQRLSEAAVRLRGRVAELESPPLSYGEFHLALLGIRLGAVDFLSAAGIRPPLIVDDPFLHLDERRAAELWEVLRSVARERQVIVATQDRLVLEHLGVAPDLTLEGVATAREGAGEPDTTKQKAKPKGKAAKTKAKSEEEAKREEEDIVEAPDLWSSAGGAQGA